MSNIRGRRLPALAVAIVVGAVVAFGCVVAGQTVVVPAEAQPSAPRATTVPQSTTSSPPAPSPVLPFNAKLVLRDIPVPEGGVRDGGCSGALIAPEWVITAGHCFHDVDDVRVSGPPPYSTTVTVGKLADSDPGGHTAQVVDVRQSPVNDLAVVRLAAAVTDIEPLALADEAPEPGQLLLFAGWGSLSSTSRVPSDHLKRGQFSVATIRQTTLEATPTAPRTVENSPCPEDSGAPFFVSDDERTGLLVAIEVSGPPCPQPGKEVIARVDVVADWIHQQIG